MNAVTDFGIDRDAGMMGVTRAMLSPVQRRAFDEIVEMCGASNAVVLESPTGSGKTAILRALADSFGGELLTWANAIDHAMRREIEATDDSVLMAIEEALERSKFVVVDSMEMLTDYHVRNRSPNFRLEAILAKAHQTRSRIVFAATTAVRDLTRSKSRFRTVEIEAFQAEDYRVFLTNALGAACVANIDFDLLYQNAPLLSGHDLRTLAGLLADEGNLTTADVIKKLEAFILSANTDLKQVEALSFDDLPGTEGIVEALETHVILPLENKQLARELNLKPKRGVLLYGPPGTGKTSIGRALAHRMEGRFHLIDGSFITEPPHVFFRKVRTIVQEAKDNAPSVLFVDDADVLFGIEHISGLSRYLLSLLDGVESKSAGQVCVMMTAMNVSKIPSAIMRSGRVELWLETKAPYAVVRAAILKRWVNAALPNYDAIDFAAVADQAENFTPADLRRITGDAQAFYAADVAANGPIQNGQTYLLHAIEALIATRSRMADNLRDESLRIGNISKKGKYAEGIGGLSQTCTTCAVTGW
jgi:transitional endoplasmic reticulum ATPase